MSFAALVHAPADSQRPAARFDSSRLEASYAPTPFNALVNGSDAIVTARVESVSAPQWNSVDGKEWLVTPEMASSAVSGIATPLQYRDAEIKIVTVLSSSNAVTAKGGDTIRVRLFGSGAYTGAKIDSPVGRTFDDIDGPFDVGSDRLIFLRAFDFPMQQGKERVVTLTAHYEANFGLDGGTATSVDSQRTVPAQALFDAVRRELSRGKLDLSPGQAHATSRNPLAEVPGVGTFGALPVDPIKEAAPVDASAARGEIAIAYTKTYAAVAAGAAAALPPVIGDAPTNSIAAPVNQPAIEVTVTAVFFQTVDHALTEYKVTTPQRGEEFRYGAADRVNGQWVVSHDTLCADLKELGAACP